MEDEEKKIDFLENSLKQIIINKRRLNRVQHFKLDLRKETFNEQIFFVCILI